MMKRVLLSVGLSLGLVWAQDLELKSVEVRASRLREVATQGTGDMIIMDRREIEKKSVTSIYETLFDEIGIDGARTGLFGSQSSIYIRGGRSSHVLFMFEGVPLNDPVGLGTSQFNRIPPVIDRLEILKGPQSILYGSDAMSGLVYLSLDRGRGKPELTLDFMYGERDTFRTMLGYKGSIDRIHFNINAALVNTKNYDFTRKNDIENDVDFYGNSSLALKVGYAWDRAILDVFFLGYDGRLNFDNCGGNVDANCIENSLMNSGGVKVSVYPLNNYNIRFTIGRTDSERVYSGDASSFGRYRGLIFYYDVENYIRFSKVALSFGGTIKEESGETSTIPVTRFRSSSIYTNILFRPVRYWNIEGGVRFNDSDTFEDRTVYKAGTSLYIRPLNVILYGNYATAYRTPNIFEYTYGNTSGLKPEESAGYQAGLKGRWCRLFAGLGVYETFYNNLIDYDSNTFSYINLGHARAEGKEIYMGVYITRSLTAKAFFNDTYSYCLEGCGYLKPKEQVPRIPKEKWGFIIKGNIGSFDTNLSFVRVGDRKDVTYEGGQPSLVQLKGYSLLNAYMGYRVGNKYKLYVYGVNLLNEDYEEVYGYNVLRRSIYAGVEVKY